MATRHIKIDGNIKDYIMRDIAQSLASIGWKVALEAYRQHTYTNRTYNLHDSYGSAVFIEGKLVEGSIRYVERAMSKKEDRHGHSISESRTGRQALHRFFENSHWIVRKKDQITVVVAAAMWYADIVESKGYVVLDEQFVKREIQNQINNNPELLNKMKEKYGFDATTVRRWLGIDEVYYYDM